MKRIHFYKNEIFEIAKILKTRFPRGKIFIQRLGEKIIIKLPKNIDHLKVEEVKLFLKTKYPKIELIFQCFV